MDGNNGKIGSDVEHNYCKAGVGGSSHDSVEVTGSPGLDSTDAARADTAESHNHPDGSQSGISGRIKNVSFQSEPVPKAMTVKYVSPSTYRKTKSMIDTRSLMDAVEGASNLPKASALQQGMQHTFALSAFQPISDHEESSNDDNVESSTKRPNTIAKRKYVRSKDRLAIAQASKSTSALDAKKKDDLSAYPEASAKLVAENKTILKLLAGHPVNGDHRDTEKSVLKHKIDNGDVEKEAEELNNSTAAATCSSSKKHLQQETPPVETPVFIENSPALTQQSEEPDLNSVVRDMITQYKDYLGLDKKTMRRYEVQNAHHYDYTNEAIEMVSHDDLYVWQLVEDLA